MIGKNAKRWLAVALLIGSLTTGRGFGACDDPNPVNCPPKPPCPPTCESTLIVLSDIAPGEAGTVRSAVGSRRRASLRLLLSLGTLLGLARPR